MKTVIALRSLVRRGSLLAAGALAFALALPAMDAGAGIANTRHNLSTTAGNPDGARISAGTEEICVFCHTPHTREASTAGVPLWNKALPSSGSYTSYSTLNSTTIDGAFTTVGSVSLACLSCHDGTQAMDNIINAPGYGNYTADGGGAGGLSYTWATGNKVTAAGAMLNDTNTMSMLGTDLTNDHPIGIQYCGGGPNQTTPTGACRDRDFVAPQNATINTNLVWWVDTAAGAGGGTAGTRERTDMILYTRAFSGTNAPSVECASCHDPHVESGTTSGGSGPAAGASFLRIANTGSAVCLACHVK